MDDGDGAITETRHIFLSSSLVKTGYFPERGMFLGQKKGQVGPQSSCFSMASAYAFKGGIAVVFHLSW